MVDEQGRPGDWVLAGEPREIRLAPVAEPGEMDGFRLARVFDVPGEDGRPRLDPARGRLTDEAQRRDVLRFLESGTVMLDTRSRSTDLLEPRRLRAVPGVFHTDGTWIWDSSVAYYLRWHQVPPEPDFLAHIIRAGYRARPVDEHVVAAARQALDKADAIYIAMRRRWQVEQGLLADPARFPFEFQQRLFDLGWHPGRDISAEVGPWLERSMADLREYRFAERGYFEYEPFEAARAVFYEFGGLRSTDSSGGVTSARVPFVIFPRPGDWHTLATDAVTAVTFAGNVGQRVFQVGYIEDGSAILVVAEDGSVHLAGAVEKFVGATFDRALMALMNGDLPQTDPYAELNDPWAER